MSQVQVKCLVFASIIITIYTPLLHVSEISLLRASTTKYIIAGALVMHNNKTRQTILRLRSVWKRAETNRHILSGTVNLRTHITDPWRNKATSQPSAVTSCLLHQLYSSSPSLECLNPADNNPAVQSGHWFPCNQIWASTPDPQNKKNTVPARLRSSPSTLLEPRGGHSLRLTAVCIYS